MTFVCNIKMILHSVSQAIKSSVWFEGEWFGYLGCF